jgi:hypothetical protein
MREELTSSLDALRNCLARTAHPGILRHQPQRARSDVSFTLVGTATNRGDDRDSTTVEAPITPADRQWEPTRRFF